MTRIVLIVMATTSAALGLLDFLFSKIIEAIIIAA